MALTITIPGAVETTTGSTAPAVLTVGVGAPGQGVPTGGTAGQVLTKVDSTDYNTVFATPSADFITSVTAPLAVATGVLSVDLSTLLPKAGGIITGNIQANNGSGYRSFDNVYSQVNVSAANIQLLNAGPGGNTLTVEWDGITFADGKQTVKFPGAATLFANAALTGNPTAPTPAINDNDTSIATTAFVIGQAGTGTPIVDGTAAVGTSLLYSREDHVHPTDTTRAALASPTFTGSPSLPTGSIGVTQSPGNNTTALATTAFVTAAVPAFATNTEAKTGTSTTLAINPASMRSNDLNPRAWQLNRASFGTAVVGTGAVAQLGGMIVYLDAGSVSLNSALCRVQSNNDASFHLYGTSTNGNASFSDKLFVSGRCGTYTVSDTAKTVMISVGKTLSSGAGSLATKGVGLKHVGGASTPLLLTVHNGTTLTDVSSSYTPVNLGVFDWEIYSDGAGNVTLNVNGTQVASTALGPTGACATAQITYQEEIFFTATPALSFNNRLICARGKLIFGP